MAKVTHSNKTFSGRVLGIEFTKGEADVDLPGHLSFFEGQDGFTIKGEADVEKALNAPVENPGAKE